MVPEIKKIPNKGGIVILGIDYKTITKQMATSLKNATGMEYNEVFDKARIVPQKKKGDGK